MKMFDIKIALNDSMTESNSYNIENGYKWCCTSWQKIIF